ncbi:MULTISPECIES: hypothetical protein [Sphingobacterium]|uniref:Uncharacterized protein n=1 Tax=Sphingobacterium detergens TaxID=1145106 RepID=A0A420AC99_SPHD1|nr:MULTISPECIES: hypothetical protein [Sphingobacterium]MCS4227630.1 hypothetical protein [Sphingobacterium sp. BIGb0165]RKE42097.1 hypothetical protein DFQ12_5698 [Sphingobacterium detergens]
MASTEDKKTKGKVEADYSDSEQNLAYNKDMDSYELDVDDNDPDYDHPANYDTLSEGAIDDDSTYDNSNPFVGDEYADREDLEEDELEDAHMRIESFKHNRLSPLDKKLAQNEEDLRDDLDEEGYPKNDR